MVSVAYGQQQDNNHDPLYFISTEYIVGYSLPVGEAFPKIHTRQGAFVHVGIFQNRNPNEWAYRLRYPKTGSSLRVIDFQNINDIRYAFH